MDINDLTLGQAKELAALFSATNDKCASKGDTTLIGKKSIVRTYAAGVHYGEVVLKDGKEVILKNSRRLWYWKTANSGISLSEVANAGLHKDSKVCAPVDTIWLEAVEIIPCTKEAIKSIEATPEHKV